MYTGNILLFWYAATCYLLKITRWCNWMYVHLVRLCGIRQTWFWMINRLYYIGRGITGKIFGGWGGQSHFSRFFPAWFLAFPGRNFNFGRPLKSFSRFLKVKRKRKKVPQLFSVIFTIKFMIFPFFPHFLPCLFHFSSVSSTFPFFFTFFFSCLIFSNLPPKISLVESLWGALCPLPPFYATVYMVISQSPVSMFFGVSLCTIL